MRKVHARFTRRNISTDKKSFTINAIRLASHTIGVASAAFLVTSPVGPAQSAQRPVLTAEECRPLSDKNYERCCFALNRKKLLTPAELDRCPPLTTARILSQREHDRNGDDRGDDASDDDGKDDADGGDDTDGQDDIIDDGDGDDTADDGDDNQDDDDGDDNQDDDDGDDNQDDDDGDDNQDDDDDGEDENGQDENDN